MRLGGSERVTRARLAIDSPPAAYRAIVEWEVRPGDERAEVFGPYGTLGAARSTATREANYATDYAGRRKVRVRVECVRAEAWQEVPAS